MWSLFFSIFLGWVALACPCESLNLSANLAQKRSLSSSVPSFSLSFNSNLEAPSMSSFKHAELLQVLLANEAYSLPPSLLQHTLGGKLLTKELAEQPEELAPESFKAHLPQLLAEDELEFSMVLGQRAMESFKDTGFDKLPRQKVPGASNTNLGNWQASSSFAKAVTFWAWTACRAPELLSETAYVINFRLKVKSFSESVAALKLRNNITLDFRGADCQLCLWGKQRASEEQPSFSILGIQLGAVVVQLSPFEHIEQLYHTASFDWGGVSSENQLAASWKLDLQQHPTVYKKLAEQLGENSPMAKLITQELDNPDAGTASEQKASAAISAFWKATTTKSLSRTLQTTLENVEKLIEQQEAEAFFEGAWQEDIPAVASSSDEASGRVDGSLPGLQSGEGNIPLHLKLRLAHALGSFSP